MGQTIRKLSSRQLKDKAVFDNRFVVEACEDFHFHYRNLRIVVSYADWPQFAKGFSDAYLRWEKMGKPFGGHTELCRKTVATIPKGNGIQINLNHNLYSPNAGKIFSKGEDTLKDKEYIHLKIRDLRLEMSKDEFEIFAESVAEAKESLCQTQE